MGGFRKNVCKTRFPEVEQIRLGRLAPKAVAFKSPPRAVFADASEARRARLKARTHHLPLSDKDASTHLQRLSEPRCMRRA